MGGKGPLQQVHELREDLDTTSEPLAEHEEALRQAMVGAEPERAEMTAIAEFLTAQPEAYLSLIPSLSVPEPAAAATATVPNADAAPATGPAALHFTLPARGAVRAEIYDIAGRRGGGRTGEKGACENNPGNAVFHETSFPVENIH